MSKPRVQSVHCNDYEEGNSLFLDFDLQSSRPSSVINTSPWIPSTGPLPRVINYRAEASGRDEFWDGRYREERGGG